MPVTPAQVRELLETVLKDKPLSADFKLRFRRGDSSPANASAAGISQENAVNYYGGKPLHLLIDECVSLYKELRVLAVPIDGVTMGSHAWLCRYLPMLDSEIFTECVKKHQTEYNYLDQSEIYLQVITAIILAYHSDPALFISKQDQFKSMVNEWLEALLTFTRMPMQEVASIPNWNTGFYTTERNLAFIGLATPQYLRISQQFSSLLGIPKWQQRVVTFNEINTMIPFVIADHEKVSTHALVEAASRLNYLKAHSSEFQASPQLPLYSPPVSRTDDLASDEDIATAATNVPPVYLTPEQQRMQDAGMRLVTQGLANFNLAMNQLSQAQNQPNQDDSRPDCRLM